MHTIQKVPIYRIYIYTSTCCITFQVVGEAVATYPLCVWAVKAEELWGAVTVCTRSWTVKYRHLAGWRTLSVTDMLMDAQFSRLEAGCPRHSSGHHGSKVSQAFRNAGYPHWLDIDTCKHPSLVSRSRWRSQSCAATCSARSFSWGVSLPHPPIILLQTLSTTKATNASTSTAWGSVCMHFQLFPRPSLSAGLDQNSITTAALTSISQDSSSTSVRYIIIMIRCIHSSDTNLSWHCTCAFEN